jgi:CHAD domain-containing protein
MSSQQLLPKLVLKKFQKNHKKLNLILENYLKNPNEKNIHDVRVAIRRLDASRSILPKNLRNKKKLQKFHSTYKKFFKTNSKIRDADIISQKIAKFSSNPFVYNILKNLQKKRKEDLQSACKIGIKLQKYKKIKLKNKISVDKLKKNFDKTALSLDDKIQKQIPIVIGSSKAILELHELRKDCKKLRYLLELSLSSNQPSAFIIKLKQMQDLMGNIHDNDITIEYLKDEENMALEDILNNENLDREKNYSKLINFLQR